MATAARKSIINNDLKSTLRVKQGLKLAEQAEDNLHALERTGMAGMKAAATNYKALADLWQNACPTGVGSYAVNNGKSMVDVAAIGQGMVEGWHKMENDLMTMWRETIECRSFDEMFNLQRKTAALMMGDWFQAIQRASCIANSGISSVCMLPPD